MRECCGSPVPPSWARARQSRSQPKTLNRGTDTSVSSCGRILLRAGPRPPSVATRPAVHWTASWVAYNDMYLYLPHGQRPHNRWRAVISEDVQFETPTGEVWKPVPNIYNFVGWASLYEVVPWIPASASQHEQLVYERTDGARMKITHTNHMVTDGTGELVVENAVWDCSLTRPGN